MILKPLAWQRIVWFALAAMTLFTLVVLFFIIIGFITSKGAHVITPEFLFGISQGSSGPALQYMPDLDMHWFRRAIPLKSLTPEVPRVLLLPAITRPVLATLPIVST